MYSGYFFASVGISSIKFLPLEHFTSTEIRKFTQFLWHMLSIDNHSASYGFFGDDIRSHPPCWEYLGIGCWFFSLTYDVKSLNSLLVHNITSLISNISTLACWTERIPWVSWTWSTSINKLHFPAVLWIEESHRLS